MVANSLYALICQRAGSKMLRQADAILNYEQIAQYLINNQYESAITCAKNFDESHQLPVEETPVIPILIEDIINYNDIRNLSDPYLHILVTLCADDPYASELIDYMAGLEKIKKYSSFANFYDMWIVDNVAWTKDFDVWYLKNTVFK
jgi:hypothetical protein